MTFDKRVQAVTDALRPYSQLMADAEADRQTALGALRDKLRAEQRAIEAQYEQTIAPAMAAVDAALQRLDEEEDAARALAAGE